MLNRFKKIALTLIAVMVGVLVSVSASALPSPRIVVKAQPRNSPASSAWQTLLLTPIEPSVWNESHSGRWSYDDGPGDSWRSDSDRGDYDDDDDKGGYDGGGFNYGGDGNDNNGGYHGGGFNYGGDDDDDDNDCGGGTNSVPEPGTLTLMGLGAAGALALRRRTS